MFKLPCADYSKGISVNQGPN